MTFLGIRATSILLVVLVSGCTVEDGGFGRTTDGSTGSSGAAATEADDTTSTGRGTDASSGDATAATSTGASDTGPADGSTGSSTGAPPPEGTDTEGETGGPSPAEGEPYGPCGPGGSCMGPGVACYESPRLRSMCLPPCDGGSPSCPPAPPDNESLVECVAIPDTPHCMLNCAAGGQASCPAGTVCEEVFDGIFRCLWP